MHYIIDVTCGAPGFNTIRFVARLAKYATASDALKMVVDAIGTEKIDRIEITQE